MKKIKRFVKQSPKLAVVLLIMLLIVSSVARAGIGFFRPNSAASIDLNKGLISHWKLDGNAQDSKGINNGSLNGSLVATTDRFGSSNSAYNFSGDDFISAGATNMPALTAAKSFSLWVRPTFDNPQGNALIRLYNTTNGTLENSVTFTAGQGFSFGAFNAGGVSFDVWQHLVITYNGTTVTIYKNGIQVGSGAASGLSAGTANTMLFGTAGGSQSYFGDMDDIRIYNRVLNASEAAALGSESAGQSRIVSASTQKGLAAQYKFDGDAKDATPISTHGTVSGAALTTDRKGSANKAYQFDGTDDSIATGTINLASTDKVSIAFWLNWNAYASDDDLAMEFSTNFSSVTNGFIVNPNSSTCSGGFEVSLKGNIGFNTGCFARPTAAAWHHFVIILDKAQTTNEVLSMYIDGVSQSATSRPNTSNNTGNFGSQPLYIMSRANTTLFGAGKMDDVRIYNRAISATDVGVLYETYNAVISVSDLQKQLVGQWSFDGDAKDRTPYSNHGTIVNGAALTTDRLSRASRAYIFDGTNDYISLPNSAGVDVETVSISAWVKTTSSSQMAIVEKVNNTFTPNRYPYVVRIASGGAAYCGKYDGTNNPGASTGAVTINDGQWHHVSCTIADGGNIKIYTDGVLRGTTSDTAVGNTTNGIDIGVGDRINSGTPVIPFNGSIDELRIWNRELSATEILRLYETY